MPTNEQLLKALRLAVNMLFEHEPPDSRGISDVTVALAAVVDGCANDACWAIIESALNPDS